MTIRCAISNWVKGVSTLETVATRRTLLDTWVYTLSFVYQALLVKGGHMLGFGLQAGRSIVKTLWLGSNTNEGNPHVSIS